MKISLRVKMMGIVTLVIVAMAVVGWRGVAGMKATNRMLNDIHDEDVIPLEKALQANIALIALNRSVMNHILYKDLQEKKVREEHVSDSRTLIEKLLQELSSVQNLSDSEKILIDGIKSRLDSIQPIEDRIFSLSRAGKEEEASGILRGELRPIVDKLDEMMSEVVTQEDKHLVAAMKAEREKFSREYRVILGIIVVAIVLSFLVAFFFANSIVSRIAASVNVLTTTASEIVTTTNQLASNASETAVSANETTTTVEEVRQTANVSAQKAKYVSESAQKASQIAKTGKKTVEDTMDGMTGIKQKMESVAESIVTLSEQSQAIGEIIAAVDDLAEQTNLLAVNASIEAVKAGEQGKGFSVVAQEIKALADQSKQATKRVRAILNDIQKATGKAVMVTEEGSKTVDAGSRLSIQAGENIQALADAIAEASQAATQIAASNQQQLAGMDQVAMAMENVKTASAQNAEGTKQLETAARNLSDLGKSLKDLVT